MNDVQINEELNPLVSVIVPVYNVANYVCKSVESICKQTYSNISILLIDDGSNDGSEKICDNLASQDNRISVIHKENSGIADTRNVGLKYSNGEYIVFVDSDDWIAPTMIEKLLRTEIAQKADIVACENEFVFDDRIITPKTSGKLICQTQDEALKTLLDDRKFRSRTWGRIYRSCLWQDVYFPVGTTYEDVSTVYKVYLKSSRVVLLDECLYSYNQRYNSIVHSNDYKSFFNLLKARILRQQELVRVKPQFLFESNASVIAAVLDIYRECSLAQNRLNKFESKRLRSVLAEYSSHRVIKLLSPRYKVEFALLSISEKAYFQLETILNKAIIFFKRMEK